MLLSLASWYLGYSSHHPLTNWEIKTKSSYQKKYTTSKPNTLMTVLYMLSQYIFLAEVLLAQAFLYLQLGTEEEWNISLSVTDHTFFSALF